MTIVNTGQGKGTATQQSASPTTGQTVTMDRGPGDSVLLLSPASSLAALTITLPDINIGNVAYITSTQSIVALIINGGTILNTVTTLAANTTLAFVKVNVGIFSRVVAS